MHEHLRLKQSLMGTRDHSDLGSSACATGVDATSGVASSEAEVEEVR
jgi:hypothetical protein